MNHPTILCVEDEATDAFLLRNVFEQVGVTHALHFVTDGQMAIEYLSGSGAYANRSEHPLPSLLLLDLKMPKKSGFDVLQWVRRHPAFQTLVVIVLTSSPNVEDARRAYLLGANSFVTKPTGFHSLADLVRRLKEWWLERNQFVSDSDAAYLQAS